MTQERRAQLFLNGIFMFIFAVCVLTAWDHRQESLRIFSSVLIALIVLLVWFYFLFGGVYKIGAILKRKGELTATEWVLLIDNAQERACLSILPAEFIMQVIIKEKLQKAKRTAVKVRRKELTDASMNLVTGHQIARAVATAIQTIPYYKETPDFLELHLKEMVEALNQKRRVPANGDVRSFQFSFLVHICQSFLKEAIEILENKPKKQKEKAITETVNFLLDKFGLLEESVHDNLEAFLLHQNTL